MWFAEAPANIALIKYMGKTNADNNLPANPSLSYTLGDLKSFVSLELQPGATSDKWEPLQFPGTLPSTLSEAAQSRYLAHFAFLKTQFKCEEHFIIRSCNNFPHSAGLASSASSFAALTKCAGLALTEITHAEQLSLEQLAQLSRHGSGSSCRSFYSPWCIWNEESVSNIELPYKNLNHLVALISKTEKRVSSSEAHRRVVTSPDYAERGNRATKRLAALTQAMEAKDWKSTYEICWDEFIDMHQLFESAESPFTYMQDDTKKLLDDIKRFWDTHNDGPITTMDAGPNVHLLFREDQEELSNDMRRFLISNYDII